MTAKILHHSPGFERMPPPTPKPDICVSCVKTPCLDISIGLRKSAVVNALQLQGLTKFEANNLLEDL